MKNQNRRFFASNDIDFSGIEAFIWLKSLFEIAKICFFINHEKQKNKCVQKNNARLLHREKMIDSSEIDLTEKYI